MRTGFLSRTAAVTTVAVAVTTVLAGSSALAEPSPEPTTGPPPNSVTVSDVERARESIDYLMTTYGVSQNEALRRLRLQARAAGIIAKVRGAVGDDLLSFSIDQKTDGKLTFLTAQADVAGKAIAPADFTETKFVKSRFTAKQHKEALAAVQQRMASRSGVETYTDFDTETIIVRYPTTEAAVATQVRGLAGRSSTHGVPVSVETPAPPPPGQQKACALLSCDTPIRGGVRLHIRKDNGDFGSCTAGFNVRGSNGWKYILTAGHCVLGVDKGGRQYAFHNGLPVVWEKAADGYDANNPSSPPDVNYSINQPSGWFNDWALLPFQTNGHDWLGYWQRPTAPHNLVASSCISPSNQPCSGNTYAIQGVYRWDDIGSNFVVCATGTGTSVVYPDTNTGYSYGTRCGVITTKYMDNYYFANTSTGKGILVNICGRDGDSGGPLFSQIDSTAYGILSGGPPTSGACSTSEGSVYSSVEFDLINARDRTGFTYNVITTSNG